MKKRIKEQEAAGEMGRRQDEAKLGLVALAAPGDNGSRGGLSAAEQEAYDRAQGSLRAFIEAAWPVIEPGRKFIGNWHIDSICRHLEAVTRGEITRLVINVPYRTSKSTIVSVMWPVWVWLQDPTKRFLTGSHKDALATRDCLKSRRIMMSSWFQTGWGDRFRFTSDQNQKTRYENNRTGCRVAFGMTSGVTGEGGDILIIDDPHNTKQAMFSNVERQNALDTFDQELFTRLNDPKRSAIVIIMQRLHEDDLTGHVLREGGWEHLCFPMEFEPERRCITCLGVQDPRTQEGELLWPERFDREWLAEQKRMLGTFGTAGQLQQNPVPSKGGLVHLTWFRTYQRLPSSDQWLEVVQAWDTAQKADELINCPWVCGTWVRTKTGYYLVDVFRDWLTYPEGKRMVRALAEKFSPNVILIEDKSTGSSLLQDLPMECSLPLLPSSPCADKITRLAQESPAIEAGLVWLPDRAPWLADFLQEITHFPLSAIADQADMLSMSLGYFRTRTAYFDFESTHRKCDYVRAMNSF
ncbi:MAG: phage terminase large subunit [bacterium]|nr:phage terminase large subunit [bacterium]